MLQKNVNYIVDTIEQKNMVLYIKYLHYYFISCMWCGKK